MLYLGDLEVAGDPRDGPQINTKLLRKTKMRVSLLTLRNLDLSSKYFLSNPNIGELKSIMINNSKYNFSC